MQLTSDPPAGSWLRRDPAARLPAPGVDHDRPLSPGEASTARAALEALQQRRPGLAVLANDCRIEQRVREQLEAGGGLPELISISKPGSPAAED